jgi:hypothetical protein
VLGVAGIGIDYASVANLRSRMQDIADAAATHAAREFQMAQSNAEKIAAVARNYALSQMDGVGVVTEVDAPGLKVRVKLDKKVELTLSKVLVGGTSEVSVSATARMTSGMPLCLLALEPLAQGAVTLYENARLTAPNCIVNTNSVSFKSIISMDDAVLKAGFICTAGGKFKTKNTNFSPEPMTDCPAMADPLAARQAPNDVLCNHLLKVVSGTVTTLQPGVYCGGLRVTNGAEVTLRPGNYIFLAGPLTVDGNATLKGDGVSIIMRGPAANLNFMTDSTISLTAPTSGPLAGILVHDDPLGLPAPDLLKIRVRVNPALREHKILSDNARMLLGTIYMPKARLIIDATRPVADKSAYTVLVVQQLDLYAGPNLFLNTDYQGSDVPVPKGVGPYGGKVLLTN